MGTGCDPAAADPRLNYPLLVVHILSTMHTEER
jgi:hypothetical protein